MKERLIDIVSTIDACAEARRNTGISTIARVHCSYDGEDKSFWFTNYNTNYTRYPALDKFGSFVPKNSYIAMNLQRNEVGSSFDYDQMNHIKRLKHHHVVIENRSNFQNQTISIAGDTLSYQYRDIKDFLLALQQNKEDITEIENKISELQQAIEELKGKNGTAKQRSQITKTINELQKEYRILTQQQEDLKNITIYIRKQGEMRYSLIVDTIQTRIKSQNLFDGKSIIINGGPGTGKTTTMIHRLAYLTDIFAIDEDEKKGLLRYNLNSKQREQLRQAIKTQRDWIFFSPSPLLKEYLATAMIKENLENASNKTWDWENFCKTVMCNNYGIIGDDTSKAPFRVCKLRDTLFYQGYDIVNEFTTFYLNQLRSLKDQLPELGVDTKSEWVSIAKRISERLQGCDYYNLTNFVSLFNSLESVYGTSCKDLLREKNDLIRSISAEICDLLELNNNAKSDIENLLDISSDEAEEIEDDVEELDVEESKFQQYIESWLKAYCNNIANKKTGMSDEKQMMTEILLPVLGDKYDTQIKRIGEMMIFEQYAKLTRGVKTIMLGNLPIRYKKFRSHLGKSKYEGCNLELLRKITRSKQGKELHYQEQSLLLGFINTLVKLIKSSTQSNINHIFIEAYDELSRPIIGIDEATDFSACEIYAMQSFLSREFNSLSLCGDLMQRLTSQGIKSWEELNSIVPNPTIVEMKTSYRQSKKLLEVAKRIYTDTLGEAPSYKPFMKSGKVPDPLVYIDKDEYSRVEWISQRISEVYRAYGEQLPSIAIFVNDKGYIPRFIESLRETEFFIKNNITAIDGTKNESQSADKYICVYPIDVVKGMEFDVVFFHDIDKFSVDTDTMKRYIYVGVSRAAFFLGITMNEENHEISKYFEKGKDWFKI